MKRIQERDSFGPGRHKYTEYAGSDGSDIDRFSSESERREGRVRMGRDFDVRRDRPPIRDHFEFRGGRDQGPLGRFNDRIQRFRHDSGPDRPIVAGGQSFNALCCTNFNPQCSDENATDVLDKEFRDFGEYNIRVVHNTDRRLFYINFKFPKDARDALNTIGSELFVHGRPVQVEPVFRKFRRSMSPEFNDHFSNRSVSPPMSRDGPRQGIQPRDHGFKHNCERFPHHLDHIDPEDDDKATRTLFVGNLVHNITEDELQKIFGKFGIVEEIDIKLPPPVLGGNAYAFVKFVNLDMAHHAKVAMSGKMIGSLSCKIGYGKVGPTTCLWIGGLGPHVSPESLEMEFDRFGAINRIEWPQGKTFAYVLYDSIDAAQAACKEMRGAILPGNEKRLRVDFADVSHICSPVVTDDHGILDRPPLPPDLEIETRKNSGWRGGNHKHFPESDRTSEKGNMRKKWGSSDNVGEVGERKRSHSRGRSVDNGLSKHKHEKADGDKNSVRSSRNHGPSHESDRASRRSREGGRSNSVHGSKETSPPSKRRKTTPDGDEKNKSDSAGKSAEDPLTIANVEHATNISDLAKCLAIVWSGALVLKSSAFAAHMHLLSGDVSLVDTLMRDITSTEMPLLRIMQRVRLDQPKLEDVARRVSVSGASGHSILLAMPGSNQTLEDSNTNTQKRSLRNLVSYLKHKEAAGVITLPPNPRQDQESGILYAFPPCAFGHDFLLKKAPKLRGFSSEEEHLVVVVVRV